MLSLASAYNKTIHSKPTIDLESLCTPEKKMDKKKSAVRLVKPARLYHMRSIDGVSERLLFRGVLIQDY